jgi:hypothetical protein
MPEKERADVDALLKNDPEAVRQLAEVDEFLATIRREGLKEEVPLSKLQAMIPKPEKPKLTLSIWRPMLVAAAAVAAIVFLRIDRRPAYETIQAVSIPTAATWIEERNGIHIDPLPEGIGKLVASERTAESGCFCIEIDGKVVHLGFTNNASMESGFSRSSIKNDRLLTNGNMVAFRSQGLFWIVSGSSSKLNWKVAERASVLFKA